MIALALAALVAAAPSAPSGDTVPIRRFALVVGANDGGTDRIRLRYARSDAEHVARVLGRLGGISPEDAIVLLDPSEAALREAFRTLEGRIREARATRRAELVVYYSGHSDDQGLLLRGARVPYADVRRWLETVGAEVRIAILDSCSSGALTRHKGGRRAPPFLVDTSTAVKGHAILTSSAADEASQESDRIEASFFTHFLLTGLRGAADASLDGKVTVSEAYQFAFGETLARTERTRSGAQHPAYDIQLVGSGDVVLTDLRGTDATLVFPEAVAGRYFVRDGEGRLVAELRKIAGRPVELGLDAGSYRIVREDGDRLAEAQVAISSGGRTEIPLRLAPIPRELTAMRGGDIAYVPVDVSIFPPISMNGDRPTWNRVQLGVIASRTTRLRGFGFAPVLWAEEDVKGVQLASAGASARGSVNGAQISMIANVAGSLRGVQLATGLNLVNGDAAGAQQSLFANWTRGQITGAQVSLGFNFARSVKGAQVALVNVAHEVRGVQLGAVTIANLAAPQCVDTSGAQDSYSASCTSADLDGAQFWWGVNLARSVKGVQLGSVNVAGEVSGVQLGAVNVSRGSLVRGWQIGVVNVSRQVDGIPLGLVNVVREGRRRFLGLADEDGVPTVGYAGGTSGFHTALELSLRRTAGGVQPWLGFGPGVHLERGRISLDLDLLGRHAVENADPYVVVMLRGLAAYAFSPSVAVVVGPTVNALLARDLASAPRAGGALGGTATIGDLARVWAGMQVGLRI